MKCLCNNEKDWVEAGVGALAATRVVGLALGLVAMMSAGVLYASCPAPVFEEDFGKGGPSNGGSLCGEAKIVDCVLGKALSVPGKQGSFARYPAGKLRGLDEFTLTFWFKMNSRERDARGNVPLNGFAALDWVWWFDMNGGSLCGHFGGLASNGEKRDLALSS